MGDSVVRIWLSRVCGFTLPAVFILCSASALPQETEKAAAEQEKPPAAAEPEADVPARPNNRELLTHALDLANKLRELANELGRPNEEATQKKRADSPAVRAQITRFFRTLHELDRTGGELLLRGEFEGLRFQTLAQQIHQSVEPVLATLRKNVKNKQGLTKGLERVAQEQRGELRRIDAAIAAEKWSVAYRELNKLVDQSDKLGLLVEPSVSAQVYAPIIERLQTVLPNYFEMRRAELKPQLMQEYESLRPNLSQLNELVSSAIDGVGSAERKQSEGQPDSGPAFVQQITAEWGRIDTSIARALASIHVIGPEAKPELTQLQSERAAARASILSAAPRMIRSESNALADDANAATVEKLYTEYLVALPQLMSALRASPDEFQEAGAALHELAAKSPDLSARVQRFERATSNTLRWRRRLARRYQQQHLKMIEGDVTLQGLLTNPPALEKDNKQRRVTQAVLLPKQTPEFVGGVWSQQWGLSPVRESELTLFWIPNADPVFVGPWRQRVSVEAPFPKDAVDAFFQGLSTELLSGEVAPLTLEAMLVVHSVAHGPYLELGGVIASAAVDALPDRLWDLAHRLDVAGAIAPESLVASPNSPALVRVQVQPTWLVHDVFFWAAPPPPQPQVKQPSPDAPTRSSAGRRSRSSGRRSSDRKQPPQPKKPTKRRRT